MILRGHFLQGKAGASAAAGAGFSDHKEKKAKEEQKKQKAAAKPKPTPKPKPAPQRVAYTCVASQSLHLPPPLFILLVGWRGLTPALRVLSPVYQPPVYRPPPVYQTPWNYVAPRNPPPAPDMYACLLTFLILSAPAIQLFSFLLFSLLFLFDAQDCGPHAV